MGIVLLLPSRALLQGGEADGFEDAQGEVRGHGLARAPVQAVRIDPEQDPGGEVVEALVEPDHAQRNEHFGRLRGLHYALPERDLFIRRCGVSRRFTKVFT